MVIGEVAGNLFLKPPALGEPALVGFVLPRNLGSLFGPI
jgi:hypothetical protein